MDKENPANSMEISASELSKQNNNVPAKKTNITIKENEILDKCLNEIITKRIQRNTNQIVEIIDPQNNTGIKIVEQDFYESVGGNLYIGNLHPKVTEETLFREFCKFGPIESVKIMYPRNDEERTRGRNCGFVKFFEREDAELAMEEIDGILIFGYELKIGWGKAMPRHPKDIINGALTVQQVSPSIYDLSRFLMSNPNYPVIRVELPASEATKTIIDCVSRLVATEGHLAEDEFKTRQKNNPHLSFIFDIHNPDHIYYKWRTYSFAQGDSERAWREEPFQMSIGGPAWIPPPQPFYDKEAAKKKTEAVPEKLKENEDLDYFKNVGFKRSGSKIEDEEEIVRLPYQLKRELLNILNELTVKQTDICNAMIFVMENAEYAKPIVKVLKEKISECTDYDQLCSLVYLLTDILFNSGSKIIPNAKNYRNELETCLPEIFEIINEFMKNKAGKITSKNIEGQFETILKNWEKWRVYDQSYLSGLKMSLKIPKNFNPKIFESDQNITLFESDFDLNGKARVAALDIAKQNYRRLLQENQDGKLNLKVMCYDNGINLGEGNITDDQMIQKLNTLEYVKLIDDFTKCQENKLQRQNSETGTPAHPQTNKKDLNLELIKMYDLYSHIVRVNMKLGDCEDGLPLTEEDIEKFGLEEDLNNMHRKYAKIGAIRGKNSFKEMPDKEEDVEMISLETKIGKITIIQSGDTQDIMDMEVDQNENKENIDGEVIEDAEWIESIIAENDFQWFSAKILKDDLLKIKTSEPKQTDEQKIDLIQEEVKVSVSVHHELERGEIPTRGRGIRGTRGSRGSKLMPVETHESMTAKFQIRKQSESNSDMMSSNSDDDQPINSMKNDYINKEIASEHSSNLIEDKSKGKLKSDSNSSNGKNRSSSGKSNDIVFFYKTIQF